MAVVTRRHCQLAHWDLAHSMLPQDLEAMEVVSVADMAVGAFVEVIAAIVDMALPGVASDTKVAVMALEDSLRRTHRQVLEVDAVALQGVDLTVSPGAQLVATGNR